jgi:hypothetical protein
VIYMRATLVATLDNRVGVGLVIWGCTAIQEHVKSVIKHPEIMVQTVRWQSCGRSDMMLSLRVVRGKGTCRVELSATGADTTSVIWCARYSMIQGRKLDISVEFGELNAKISYLNTFTKTVSVMCSGSLNQIRGMSISTGFSCQLCVVDSCIMDK